MAKQQINTSQQPNIKRQNNTTNTAPAGARIETGWGFMTGTGAAFISKQNTFSTAFTSAPIVIVQCCGYRDNSDPTLISDFGQYEDIHIAAGLVTTSGFYATGKYITNGAIATTRRFGYSWIAIGV